MPHHGIPAIYTVGNSQGLLQGGFYKLIPRLLSSLSPSLWWEFQQRFFSFHTVNHFLVVLSAICLSTHVSTSSFWTALCKAKKKLGTFSHALSVIYEDACKLKDWVGWTSLPVHVLSAQPKRCRTDCRGSSVAQMGSDTYSTEPFSLKAFKYMKQTRFIFRSLALTERICMSKSDRLRPQTIMNSKEGRLPTLLVPTTYLIILTHFNGIFQAT